MEERRICEHCAKRPSFNLVLKLKMIVINHPFDISACYCHEGLQIYMMNYWDGRY